MLEAGLDLPRLVTGLGDEDVAIAEQYYVETTHRRALEKIQDEAEAWDLADATVRAATQLICNAGGFSHQHEFNEFWKAHDMVEAKKEADEFQQARRSRPHRAMALPMDERPRIAGTMIDKNSTDYIEGAGRMTLAPGGVWYERKL